MIIQTTNELPGLVLRQNERVFIVEVQASFHYYADAEVEDIEQSTLDAGHAVECNNGGYFICV